MSTGRLCGFTPVTFCRKLSRMQVARRLALKRLIRGPHDFRRGKTSKNVENKNSKEIGRKKTEISSAETCPENINSMKSDVVVEDNEAVAVTPLSVKEEKQVKTPRISNVEDSPKCAVNFILMVELRKNIFAFRDMIDLPPLYGTLSVTEIIAHTMKDLQKISPEIVTINKSFDMEGADMDKMLIFFYEDLRAIGDSWIMDRDWIDRSNYKNSGVGRNKSDRLVEHVLAALDGLIKMTRKRFGMMDLDSDNEKKSFTPKGVSEAKTLSRSVSTYSDSNTNTSFYPSPLTPTSVLPGTMATMSSSSSTSPSLWNLRSQALDKLSPVDLKNFAMQILSQRDQQNDNDLEFKNVIEEEQIGDLGQKQDQEDCSVSETEHRIETEDHCSQSTETDHGIETEDHSSESFKTEHGIETEDHSPETEDHSSESIKTEHEIETEDHSSGKIIQTNTTESSSEMTQIPPPPPPPPPQSQTRSQPLQTLKKKPNNPLSQPPENKSPAPPPPPPTKSQETNPSCPFPRPEGDNAASTPPPPAPPGSGMSLRAKKATSKLRRSAQIANLYWVLKGKLEGRGGVEAKTKSSKGQKNVAEKSPVTNKKSGMADALAEMTKRSVYFQQIEEDVQKYAKLIEELKSSILSFKTRDIEELIEFHSKVESVLEKLTDETQVLAKFENFPQKKLEAIRTAGVVYKKLHGILTELKNWKIELPLNDLLDKIERYFNKVKGEIESIERTKDEDAKMFQKYNINLDFEILVQVKETMVDVSSNCMELALKERREANEEAKKSEEISTKTVMNMKEERAKRLWRAFQFAFKVYTFAGGHDERADHLTRQLAHEIQTDPQSVPSIVS